MSTMHSHLHHKPYTVSQGSNRCPELYGCLLVLHITGKTTRECINSGVMMEYWNGTTRGANKKTYTHAIPIEDATIQLPLIILE